MPKGRRGRVPIRLRTVPNMVDKEKAVALARMIIKKKNLRLTVEESLLVSRELLKALNLKDD